MCTRFGLEARLGYIEVNQVSQNYARLDLGARLDGIHTSESSWSNARTIGFGSTFGYKVWFCMVCVTKKRNDIRRGQWKRCQKIHIITNNDKR